MIKLEIKIKEDSIIDYEKVTATTLNVSIKEKTKKVTRWRIGSIKII